jgi:2'-5' RNA ligase
MRLFVAVDLDADTRAAIHREQQRVAKAVELAHGSRIRWVAPGAMHVTLSFLGDVPDQRAVLIADALARDVDLEPFAIVFAELGVFPPRGAPRALWVGISEGARELEMLQRILANRVRACGIPLEGRPFSAHLTLGRWRDARPSDRGCVLAAGRSTRVARQHVDHATLYRSQLSAAGPSYTALARATLKACSPE